MPLAGRLLAYLDPLILLTYAVVHLPLVLLFNPFLLLRSPKQFQEKWFATYWKKLGPKMAASPEQMPHIHELMTRAHGMVLEIGPGGGDQMRHFNSVSDRIQKIIAAEPNANLHPALLQRASECGLGGGKYVPLACGAEPNSLLPALKKAGLLPESPATIADQGIFDSIITVKSMCSAPQNEMPAIAAVIQSLLRPGGEFLFFEHVENHTDKLTQLWVWLLGWVWPIAMGNCHLNGKLDRVVLGMSGWDTRVQTTDQFQGYNVFRYVKGIARKTY